MNKKPFNALNDCFVRYFFTDKGGEKVLLDFINAVMISADMKTFKAVEILNPFNLKKHYNDKETIVDVKCITKNGTVVIIEVQLSGNSRFPERILYYWSANYSKLLKKGEEHEDLTPVISINLLNFNLKKHYKDKETIVDVKCITKNGTVVIIEVQLSGNSRFPERILYYWSANYSKLLKKGEEYEDLTPVISINLLNFNLNKVNKNVHSCYMIYDTKSEKLLTDHLQIHIIELKKFKFKDNDLKRI